MLDRNEKLVEKLNLFQPATLAGYPSALALMAGEQAAGRLRITPVLARTAGENLTEEIRSNISGSLGCRVIDSYASSEAPALGTECQYQLAAHQHRLARLRARRGRLLPHSTGEALGNRADYQPGQPGATVHPLRPWRQGHGQA